MDVLNLLAVLLFSRVLAVLFEKLGIASITAYIVSGYVLGRSLLGVFEDVDPSLLDLSLITLFFYTGLNVDLRISKDVARESVTLSSLGVLFTVAIVTLAMYLVSNDLMTSVIVGIALSNTATEVVLLVVTPRELGNEIVRAVLITSSFIDDLLMIFFIAVLGLFTDNNGSAVLPYLIKHISFAIAVLALGYVISKLLSNALVSPRDIVNTAVTMLFSVTLAGYLLGIDLAFSAYFAGISLSILRLARSPTLVNIVRLNDLMNYISEVLDMFLIPIFFLYLGGNITSIDAYIFLTILASSFVGKLIGCSLQYVIKGEFVNGLIYGILMNARGGLESAIALLAFNYGLVSSGIYSTIVAVAITSSLTVSLMVRVLRRYLRVI